MKAFINNICIGGQKYSIMDRCICWYESRHHIDRPDGSKVERPTRIQKVLGSTTARSSFLFNSNCMWPTLYEGEVEAGGENDE